MCRRSEAETDGTATPRPTPPTTGRWASAPRRPTARRPWAPSVRRLGVQRGLCDVACAGCTTDADRDGYGIGTGCAGLDCDDTIDTVGPTAQRPCHSFAASLIGVGTCRSGSESCVAGSWRGVCVGELGPTAETCNSRDDDCDGSTDEGLGSFTCGLGVCQATVPGCGAGGIVATCSPGSTPSSRDPCGGGDQDCDGSVDEDCLPCVKVSPGGDDSDAVADDNATPFQHIQAAIDWAADPAAPPTRPQRVCVAAGAVCSGSSFATYAENLRMAEAVDVYGSYESTGWTRCAAITTAIQSSTDSGVYFPSTVAHATALDGFELRRRTSNLTVGVTVDGATNVTLNWLRIQDTPTSQTSIGVRLLSGAQAAVTNSDILGGAGTVLTVGIRAEGGSRLVVRDNCALWDAGGRCNEWCGDTSTPRDGIRGRMWPGGVGESYVVLLDDSPGALIERSSLCSTDTAVGAGIRVRGNAAGTIIRANRIGAWGGDNESHGIRLDACGGAAPWIVDNNKIHGEGGSTSALADGVHVEGDCHPVIERNVEIVGTAEGRGFEPSGVYCRPDAASVASRCVVVDNALIQGSSFGSPDVSIGVRCGRGSCARIEGNTITGRGGNHPYGLWLENTGVFVADNSIAGGCPTGASYGVLSVNAWPRLENNVISGGTCNGGASSGAVYTGLLVRLADGGNEPDVHSNAIDAGGSAGLACTGVAVRLEPVPGATPPSGPMAVFRNDILRAGLCTTNRVFIEADATVDPRILENNDFDPFNAPDALYLDEGVTTLTLLVDVNGLGRPTTSRLNISADPLFVNYGIGNLHINPGSPCDGAGTAPGPPPVDMDDPARSPTSPDLGPDET